MPSPANNIDRTTSLHLNNEAKFFCFTLGEMSETVFAINIFKVREVVTYSGHVTAYDTALVMGLVDVRGEILPLVDLLLWIAGKSSWSPDTPAKHLTIMICEYGNIVLGLCIGRARGIITKSWHDIEQGIGAGGSLGKITGMTRDQGKIVQILDIEKMLADAFPSLYVNEEISEPSGYWQATKKLLLAADDSPMVRKQIEKFANRHNIRIHLFENGKKLIDELEKIDSNDIGAIFTDLEMPEMSGFEVVRLVRANRQWADIPIIIHTSMSSESNIKMTAEMGADGFVGKGDWDALSGYLKNYFCKKDA